MQDVLLVLPIVGPLDLYVQEEYELAPDRQMWKRRLTRIPQGLLSIATYLHQNGVSVKIFDCRLYMSRGQNEQLYMSLASAISETQFIVGISVLTMHVEQALKITRLVKNVNSNLTVVWGGYHPTLFPEQTISDPEVDFIIRGEGEEPMLALWENIVPSDKASDMFSSVPSLGVNWHGHIQLNPLGEPFDPNKLERPYYKALDIEAYLTKQSYNPDKVLRGIEYNGSRGCSYSCGFCINRVLPQQHIWRARSPEKVATDLQYAKDEFHIEYVFFEEEFPFLNPHRTEELAVEMSRLDLPFYGNIRVDMVANKPDMLRVLRMANWTETSVGAESGSNRILKYLKKGITTEQTLRVAHILNDLDVYCLYSFMTDLPTETTEEKMETFKLMRQLKKIHPNSEFIGPQTYRPYPKTEYYDKLVASGRFKEPATLKGWVKSGMSMFFAQ